MDNTFIKKDTAPVEVLELQKKVYSNSKLKVGDNVKLKGDEQSPKMVISQKKVSSRTDYTFGFEEIYIQYEVQWFNKSKQDFTAKWFVEDCLEKL